MSLTRTESALLGLLAWGGERSGYDLRALAARSIGYIWTPTRSQLYAVLPRLAAAGLTARRDVTQDGRPDKQLHRITPAGRDALREWLSEVEDLEAHDRDGLLLKLFLAAHGPPGAARRQLEAFRDRTVERRGEYAAIVERIEAGDEPDRHPLLTVRLGIALSDATLAWAEETLAELEAGAPTRRAARAGSASSP